MKEIKFNKSSVYEYFKKKAKDYDLVDNQTYWQLSDNLLWEIFDSEVLSKLPSDFSFLDAGGGTGRWSKKILTKYTESKGTICDLSKEMLAQAKLKKNKIFEERLNLIEGDILNMNDLESGKFDLTFNFHNVLGFVESPKKALREMVRVTKKGGFLVSFIPNLYHNIFFNISLKRFEEAEIALKTGKGRFTSDMPYMNLFTPESIKKLYLNIGLKNLIIKGFPITIYPGYQETQIKGTSENLSDTLEGENFDKIFNIEKNLIVNQDSSSRGNNLFVIGKKKED